MPRVARVVRPTARTGFWGNWTGFRRYLGADGVGNGRRSVQGLHRLTREDPCSTETTREEEPQQNEPRTEQNQNERCTRTNDAPGLSTPTPFVGRCSALPPPRTPPRSWPLPPSRRFQKGLEEGAFLPLGRVTSRIRQSGEDAPPPPSFHSGDEGRTIRAGDIWARVLGASFGREMSLHALLLLPPPLLPSVPQRS